MEVRGKTKIYRKDFDGHPAYSRRISSQKYENGQKGAWISDFENVQFPNGTQIADGTVVDITKAFEAVYENRKGEVKRKLVVLEYSTDESLPARPTDEGFTALQNDDIPF